ncbi:hypothetical protein [Chromobacterium amazonense]|uniref:hypothetical protein n=1 Tax=Chromobacterium amazonense TaxID=1382803 RepID=UPI0031F62680
MSTERACLASAHNGNLAAARRCGFQTAFIPWLPELGPNQQTDLMAEQDWVTGSLVELAGML